MQCKGRNIRGSTLLALISTAIRLQDILTDNFQPLSEPLHLPITQACGPDWGHSEVVFPYAPAKELSAQKSEKLSSGISGSPLWVRSAQVLVSSTFYFILFYIFLF